MSIRSRIDRRTTLNWTAAVVVWLTTVGATALLVEDVWLLGSVAAFALFIIWRIVAGPRGGHVVSRIQDWASDFEKLHSERPDWESLGDATSGVGSYGGQVLPMRVAATEDGLIVELGKGIDTIRINWGVVSRLCTGKYQFGGDIQPIVEVFLCDVEHKPLVLPWHESYLRVSPRSVGVDLDPVEVRVLG